MHIIGLQGLLVALELLVVLELLVDLVDPEVQEILAILEDLMVLVDLGRLVVL
jgi:hypothetical protein